MVIGVITNIKIARRDWRIGQHMRQQQFKSGFAMPFALLLSINHKAKNVASQLLGLLPTKHGKANHRIIGINSQWR